ncbi:hypothetical protein VPH35_063910 [Triticum aestivum]
MAAALPNDVLLEILLRLDDAADLFRCATACKRLRGLVIDSSFLLRRWPEHVRPSLAGLFIKDRGRYQGSKVLVPTPRSELGPGRRRALSCFVPGISARLLYHAVPLFSSRGLLLARLAPKDTSWSVVHLAVCNLLTGTCDVLLPIQLGLASLSPASPAGERSGCAIVTGTDYRRSSSDDEEPRGNSPLFKVIVLTVSCKDDLKFYLNTFSSDEPSWRAMRTVSFGATIDANASGSFCQSDAVVRHGTAHWLFRNETARCFCLVGVNAQSGHVSFTRLPVPMMTEVDYPCLCSGSATDGTLSVPHMQWGGSPVELMIQPRKENQGRERLYIVGEKCGKLIVKDRRGRVYTGNLSTGAMEEVADWPRMCHINTPNVVPWRWIGRRSLFPALVP